MLERLPAKGGFLGAWENEGQLGFAMLPGEKIEKLKGAAYRKHPRLVTNAKGETLLVWTEGISFGKGGAVGWQIFDEQGQPKGPIGHADGLPGHGNVAAVALPDGSFAVIF